MHNAFRYTHMCVNLTRSHCWVQCSLQSYHFLLRSTPATNYSLWLDESISMPKGSLGYCDLQFWFHCLIFKYLPYRCFVGLREHFRKCGVVAQHCKIAKVIIIQIFQVFTFFSFYYLLGKSIFSSEKSCVKAFPDSSLASSDTNLVPKCHFL